MWKSGLDSAGSEWSPVTVFCESVTNRSGINLSNNLLHGRLCAVDLVNFYSCALVTATDAWTSSQTMQVARRTASLCCELGNELRLRYTSLNPGWHVMSHAVAGKRMYRVNEKE
jgi:hypothetical protein